LDNLYNSTTSESDGAALAELLPTGSGSKKAAAQSLECYHFLVDHTSRQYVDKRKCRLHPLPLLTCEGNGNGGGDFTGSDPNIGAWARHIISVERKPPAGFSALKFNPKEEGEVDSDGEDDDDSEDEGVGSSDDSESESDTEPPEHKEPAAKRVKKDPEPVEVLGEALSRTSGASAAPGPSVSPSSWRDLKQAKVSKKAAAGAGRG